METNAPSPQNLCAEAPGECTLKKRRGRIQEITPGEETIPKNVFVRSLSISTFALIYAPNPFTLQII